MTTASATPRLWSAVRRLRTHYLPAIGLFVLGLAFWEAVVVVFDIQGFLLPKPSAIARVYVQEQSVVWSAGLVTLGEAVGGFVIGSAAAIIVAFGVSRWNMIREGAMPFAVAASSAPIIALAPIANAWFGSTNPISKMAVVAVMVFFPVMINTVRGLTLVDPSELELMRSYAASGWAILRRVRLPNALPYLFSAFKVASALALIGAIVSEYFGGPRNALGVYISQQASFLKLTNAWAAILVGSMLGVAFYLLIVAVERMVMPWHVSIRRP